MADSIFIKIIRGDIPCHKIYEDDKTLAFLDIFPIVPGHVLVVSKKQVEYLWDLPDEDYQAVMAACKKVANQLRKVLRVKYVGVKVVGTDVPHTHLHLVPFNDAKDYYKRRNPVQADDIELANLAAKLAL
ncbi:HIT family protein [Candidatus Saccharibacteria bacterium CG10_big_fil_rev_8_21_14_0_10_47_8]|nr:MAG: HIT family protein [Candidatus Saccharibacteria bacterium CG10_big_fil_rev_8_21_14_0_10_47_8]